MVLDVARESVTRGARGSELENGSPAPRIAIYAHDTYGMGHVRRSLNIINALAAKRPDAAILLITGSQALALLDDRPRNVDFVKLPTIAHTGDDESRPPHLPIGVKETVAIRTNLISELLRTFAPDVFLIDNFALGAKKELKPALEMLRNTPTRIIVGLRDIVDEPDATRKQWHRDGIFDALDNLMDLILVYGDRAMFDVGDNYALSDTARTKIRYCGYVLNAADRPVRTPDLMTEFGLSAPCVLVTAGGGGDGLPLLTNFLKAKADLPGVSALVVTGPLMGNPERLEIQRLADASENTAVTRFLPHLVDYLAVVDLVVCMGGYNTMTDLLRHRPRAIVVPRYWRFGEHRRSEKVITEGEQYLRARSLERLGVASCLDPNSLSPEYLATCIRDALNKPRPSQDQVFDTDGAQNAATHILDQIEIARANHG